MTTHGSAAKAAREQKERHPELYCPVDRCLWRTGGGRCPKHPAPVAVELAEMEARDPKLRGLGERVERLGRALVAQASGLPRLPVAGERVEYRAGFESPVYHGTATGKPCGDETCGYVHVIEDRRGLHHIDPSYFLTPGKDTKWARVIL
jgi:hypothetical protein